MAVSTNGDDIGSGIAPFITKIASSHESPDDIYTVGLSGVWHSADFGATWSLTDMGDASWGPMHSFMEVRASETDAVIVWAGVNMDDPYRVQVSTDRGATLSATSAYTENPVTLGYISGLATHRTEPNTHL